MIKKISAVVLALVLCLTVVVMPVSALELNGAKIAYELKWDKATYNPGDNATLSIYVDAEDSLSLGTGAITIAFNSAVIDPADNPINTIREKSTTNADFATFYKKASVNTSYFTAESLMTALKKQNTPEENAKYDTYLKFLMAKDSSGGSHANTGTNKAGYGGDEFDPTVPIVTYTFKISDSVAPGTAVEAAITKGSYSVTPAAQAQTNWKYYTNPHNATTTANIAVADFNATAAVATATIGSAAPTLALTNKNQIKYIKNADDSFKEINVRARASINAAELQALVGVTANDDVELKIVEAGFVYGATVDKATAEGVIAGTPAEGYTKKPVSYIQNNGTEYVFTCVTTGLTTDKIASSDYQALAYIILNVGGTQYTFTYDATVDVSPKALYNGTYARANSTYGWSLTAIA